MRKGEVIDLDAVVDSIHKAVSDAEESAGRGDSQCLRGCTWTHPRFNTAAASPSLSDEREITDEQVSSVLQNAKAVNIPVDNVVVHAIRQHFFVDGHDGIQNPVGMIGARLEADVHVIYGVRTRLQNTIKCIKEVPLDVQNIAVAGFASALAVLTTEHQQQGAVVIDMGAGTTFYQNGK